MSVVCIAVSISSKRARTRKYALMLRRVFYRADATDVSTDVCEGDGGSVGVVHVCTIVSVCLSLSLQGRRRHDSNQKDVGIDSRRRRRRREVAGRR